MSNNILDLAKQELDKHDCFLENRNMYADYFTKVLSKDVPFSMAFAIANFTIATYVGHFHYKIELSEDNRVPMNLLAFILAKSGAKKTSSVLKMEKMLAPGLDLINRARTERELAKAREMEAQPRTLMPLSNALSTVPGLLQNLNNFKDEGIGLPNMVVDEVSTELATNPDFIPNVQVAAQLFDDGDCKVKVLKDTEMQSEEVKGMGLCALFIGSEKGILEDPSVLRKFELEFISKLGRRCFLIYPDFVIEVKSEFLTIDDYLSIEQADEDIQGQFSEKIKQRVGAMAADLMMNDTNFMGIEDDALRLWRVYEAYNKALAKEIDEENEAEMLEQEHRHWKMIKLAGAYAVWNNKKKISIQEVKEAIYAAELTGDDLKKFVLKAKREVYEMLLEYFQKNNVPLSTHDMIKKGWIKKRANLIDIIVNANSKLAGKGTIELIGDEVSYKAFNFLTDKSPMFACFKKLPPMEVKERLAEYDTDSNAKMAIESVRPTLEKKLGRTATVKECCREFEKIKRGYLINEGYVYKETTWEKLGNLPANDTAYTPFKFNEGRRGKDHIGSPARFIVLDVDESEETLYEVADRLDDYRYHIATTSDTDNPYKFRVVLPLDIEVDLDRTKWKEFYAMVGMHLDLNIDKLPQSQIFYGFSSEEQKKDDEDNLMFTADGKKIMKPGKVISNLEGMALEASKIVPEIKVEVRVVQPASEAKRNAIWEDRKREWKYAYEAKSGSGYHLALFKAMRHAFDLGFSYNSNMELIDDIIDENGTAPRNGFMPSLISQTKELYGMEDDKY